MNDPKENWSIQSRSVSCLLFLRKKLGDLVESKELDKNKRCGKFAIISNKFLLSLFDFKDISDLKISFVSPLWTIKEFFDFMDNKIVPVLIVIQDEIEKLNENSDQDYNLNDIDDYNYDLGFE